MSEADFLQISDREPKDRRHTQQQMTIKGGPTSLLSENPLKHESSTKMIPENSTRIDHEDNRLV